MIFHETVPSTVSCGSAPFCRLRVPYCRHTLTGRLASYTISVHIRVHSIHSHSHSLHIRSHSIRAIHIQCVLIHIQSTFIHIRLKNIHMQFAFIHIQFASFSSSPHPSAFSPNSFPSYAHSSTFSQEYTERP